MSGGERPLPSSAESEPDDDEPSPAESAAPSSTAPDDVVRAPPVQFKLSTFVLTFLFLLGILMIFNPPTRLQVAQLIGAPLAWAIGFGGSYLLLTMLLAGVIEMLLTALAYNWTTDWVKAARVQSWSGAFRKVQMAAIKSGKKDRIASLQPHQQELTKLTGEVSMAQLKGMAVTWFLVIAIYTWVGIFIGLNAAHSVVNIGGDMVSLTQKEWIVPLWFLLFSLYTVPFSLAFRRILKHYSLRRYADRRTTPPPESSASGGGA
ncbi:MAG: EMC3/TMCO1 family protein [Thermoplasmata archaeon]|nr:EMC3/TMCO1 family protein [Thermoplasmata archaeon]